MLKSIIVGGIKWISIGARFVAKRKQKNTANIAIPLSLIILLGLSSFTPIGDMLNELIQKVQGKYSYTLESIPEYDGRPYIILNENEPYFSIKDYDTSSSFEEYSELDFLGRARVAVSNIGLDLMPKEERGSIGMIKPSGWHTVKYDFVDGKYLYNRCHLIGFQLTGENANEKNLITCTRSMNTGVMLDYENKVAKYIKDTKNHVLYRVTPFYKENELLARGVEMEAISIEDEGKGIKFNIFVYNTEKGVIIDYKTGESKEE